MQLRDVLIRCSPLIEDYTAKLCPSCSDVCCKQKHGAYGKRDVAYLGSLNIPVPLRDETRPPEGSCQYLDAEGCIHPRWLRPFKCTWYFCDPLLRAMDEGPARKARTLSAGIREMIGLYDAIGEERTNHGE